jgi:uncharacterized membrane protein
MWLYYVGGFFGWLLGLMVVSVIVLVIVCWCCGVSVDSLMTWGEDTATLTCFHCGQQTAAGGKTCQHCGGELQ